MLLQDRTLDLGRSSESVEAVSFTKVRFGGCLNSINGAILAARVSGIAPLVSCVASIGC